MFKRILIFLLLLSPLAHAQNGNDRGGGDPVAAEVFNIARTISNKLTKWTNDGTIHLTTEQVSKIQNLVNPETHSLLIVSSERVYRFPELAPSLDAIEVTLVNIAHHQPPMIEVGRIRWNEIEGKSLEKEMMVLHELMGAAGLTENGARIDDQFYISYELKTKKLAEQKGFEERLMNSLIKLHDLNLGVFHLYDSLLKSFAENIELTHDYSKLLKPEYFEKNMQDALDYYKSASNKVIRDFEISNKNIDPQLNNWGMNVLNTYMNKYLKMVQMLLQDTSDSNSLYNYIRKKCSVSNPNDPELVEACILKVMESGVQDTLDEIYKKELNDQLSEELTAQIKKIRK